MSVLTFTHGIVSHSTTTGIPGDTPNFLVINGGKVDLNALLDQPLVVAIAQRDANYLLTLQDAGVIQAWGYGATSGTNAEFDNVNGGGAATNEYYLWIDIDRATGQITYGHTKVEPSSGPTAPFAPVDRPNDTHWFDTTTNTTKVWRASGIGPTYGTWVEVVRLVIAKYIYSVDFFSLSENSPSFIGTTAGLVGSYRAGALIYDSAGNPVKRTTSTNVTLFFTTDDVFTSGLPSLSSPVAGNRARYETFLVDAIGATPAPAYSMVRFSDFNQALPLNPLLQPNSLYGMIESPIGASGDLVQVTMSGVVNNPNWTWSTVGQQIFVDKDNAGLLVTVEDDGYVPLAEQLPVAVALTSTSVIIRVPELTLTQATGTATSHSSLTDLGADDHTQYLPVDGSRGMVGNLGMGTNNITNVGTVDGRDVSTDGSTLDAHVADTSIHFTLGSPIGSIIPHGNLQDVGTNTHAQIDTHIANTDIHFTLGSPIGSVIDHTVLQNVGTNTHLQIDSHIADTSIHQSLTVADVNGSPITSVGDVNTILFNNSSGFDVVDQTGGVVRIDFNSAFNPIIVQGGSPVQTLTASGEEPLKLIAGSNITLSGNTGASPKEITISSTAGGGIPNRIEDQDGDTVVRVEGSPADDDVIRFHTGISPVGFLAQTDIMVLSSAELTVNMGLGGTGSPLGAAPINLTAGSGISAGVPGGDINITSGDVGINAAGRGGDINITSGDGFGPFGTFVEGNRGGNINITAGGRGSSTHAFGGDINLTAGTGGTITNDGGWIKIKSGQAYGGLPANQGITILEGAGGSGQIPGPVIIQSHVGAISQTTELRFHALGVTRDPSNKTSTPAGGWVGFQAPNVVAGATVWTLPAADGGTGQVLTTDGGLGLYWSTPSGGGGGSPVTIPSMISDADGDTYVQVEESPDEDVVRIGIGDTSDNRYIALPDVVTISQSGFNIDMGNAKPFGSPVGGESPVRSGAPISIYAGDNSNGDGYGGSVTIRGGYSYTATGSFAGGGGDITLAAGNSSTASGGSIVIAGGEHSLIGEVTLTGRTIRASASGTGEDVEVRNTSGSAPGGIRFYDNDDSAYVRLRAPATTVTRFWTLPQDNPATVAGQFLTTDASGVLSFATPAGGGGGSSLGGIRVQEEGTDIITGSPLPPFTTLNFIGDSITATNAGGAVANITVTDAFGVQVKEEGTHIGGSPAPLFTSINFVGTTVTATDAGGGEATVTVTAASSGGIDGIAVAEEGSDIGGSPSSFTRLNFVGANVTATDAGSGTATITVTGAGAGGSPDITARKYTTVVSFSGSPLTETITHNLGEKYVIVQLYDSNDEQIGVSTVKLIDANSLEVSVNTALSNVTVVVIG